MIEFKKHNDYSIIIYIEDYPTKWFKLAFAHNVYKTSQWLSNSPKFKNWRFMNVYARRTGRLIITYKKNDYIQAFPK